MNSKLVPVTSKVHVSLTLSLILGEDHYTIAVPVMKVLRIISLSEIVFESHIAYSGQRLNVTNASK